MELEQPSNWQALTCLSKHEQPVRDPKDTAPQRAEFPEAIITREAPNPPTMDREEKLPVEDLPAAEKEMPPYEGDRTPTMLQLNYQEVSTEVEARIRTSSRRWKASARVLGSREHESLNWNKAFSAVQYQREEQQYYESMHQEDYKIQENMQDPLSYLDSSDPDIMYFNQAMKQPDHKEFLNTAIREVNSHC